VWCITCASSSPSPLSYHLSFHVPHSSVLTFIDHHLHTCCVMMYVLEWHRMWRLCISFIIALVTCVAWSPLFFKW
jgi:hypothetical protein